MTSPININKLFYCKFINNKNLFYLLWLSSQMFSGEFIEFSPSFKLRSERQRRIIFNWPFNKVIVLDFMDRTIRVIETRPSRKLFFFAWRQSRSCEKEADVYLGAHKPGLITGWKRFRIFFERGRQTVPPSYGYRFD